MTIKADLFQFTDGDDIWRITSASGDITGPSVGLSGSATYDSQPVNRGGTHIDGQDVVVNNLSVFVGINTELGQLAKNRAFQNKKLSLTCLTKYDSTYVVVWKGRLSVVKPRESDVELNFESKLTSQRRHTLKMAWQRECPHRLYDANCTVEKDSNWNTITVESAIGTDGTTFEFSCDGFDDDDWLELMLGMGTRDDQSEPHTIMSVEPGGAGATIQFKSPWALEVGDDIRGYRGCDKLLSTCRETFDNVLNFGGFPLIPKKNPHTGRFDNES